MSSALDEVNGKKRKVNLEPTNNLVTPLLTDMYQISMTYAHWKAKRCEDHSVFDLFFRKNPFSGEFCVFAGLDEVLKFLASYKFSETDIEYLQSIMPACEPAFFTWLKTLDCSQVKVYAINQGMLVFPREPLMRIEGPLAICQLLETTLLNLVNFASLVTTNATRMRLAAGADKSMLEFGLRRAQGPDGGISASKYCIIGGFDGTSNVLAGKLFGLTVKGTHAHAYVMAHTSIDLLHTRMIKSSTGQEVDFVNLVMQKKAQLGEFPSANMGELAAFIEYSQAFPHGMLALVDTYDTLQSGVPNFICVAAALYDLGYVPLGIRLDSGDLAYLSRETRKLFVHADQVFGFTNRLVKMNIVASNDLNEKVLASLNKEGHEINTFGIGTHLVTCHDQPALGCVYKLVEINGIPRIKLSQEVEKVVLPGSKSVFRIYGKDGTSIMDLIQLSSESAPVVGVPLLCRHPFQENKRAMVTPSRVEPLLNLVWDCSQLPQGVPTLESSKETCKQQIGSIRSDHIRGVHPTPYKVSVSQHLYDFLHQLWHKEAPIVTLE